MGSRGLPLGPDAILGAAGGLGLPRCLEVAQDKKTASRGFDLSDPPAAGSPEFGRLLEGRHLPDIGGFEDGVDVQVTRSSATKGSTDIEELFYCAIAGARERLWVTTAFFVPPDAFVDALCASAGGEVDVQILVNGPHIDKDVLRQCHPALDGRARRRPRRARPVLGMRVMTRRCVMIVHPGGTRGWDRHGPDGCEPRQAGSPEPMASAGRRATEQMMTPH